MPIRCKMALSSITSSDFGSGYGQKTARFTAIYDPKVCEEDAGFQKATPSGSAEFVIDNPAAIEQLVAGTSYYFDITPVPAPEAVVAT